MVKLKTILLVEDSPNDVELTLEALDEHGLVNRVITVNDGVEAMDFLLCREKFKTRPQINPAVILLDIKMPRMNGMEVLEAIRNNDKLKTIPVVILTSSREEPDLKKCYELGANAYVVKPVDFQQFIAAVRQVGVFWALINELPPQK
ncbi:MAG: response regulator [Bacteroidales bacterium]|nr:response regulator [Bacteroidales bacterium]